MPKRRANGEGSLRKRKDGRWEGRYTAGYDPTTGKPIHKNVLAKTQTEAKEKLKQSIADAAFAVGSAFRHGINSFIFGNQQTYHKPTLIATVTGQS